MDNFILITHIIFTDIHHLRKQVEDSLSFHCISSAAFMDQKDFILSKSANPDNVSIK